MYRLFMRLAGLGTMLAGLDRNREHARLANLYPRDPQSTQADVVDNDSHMTQATARTWMHSYPMHP